MRLSDAIAGYWLDKRLDMSKTTIPGYERTFGRLVSFLDDPDFAAVTSDDIRRFLAHLSSHYKLSRRSVHDAWIPLSSLWTWAEKELGTVHILRGRVKPTRYTRRAIEAFTEDQVKAIIAATETTAGGRSRPTGDRDRAIVLVLVDCGLRASELCALTVGDYDSKRGRLHVRHGKNDKARFVVIGARSQKAVWRYLTARPDAGPADPLFATRSNLHLERTGLRQLLARTGNRAGVASVHPHRFRHTFAINFLRNGGNVLTLRELLGHESLTMVQRYARIVDADIDRAQVHSPADTWRL